MVGKSQPFKNLVQKTKTEQSVDKIDKHKKSYFGALVLYHLITYANFPQNRLYYI